MLHRNFQPSFGDFLAALPNTVLGNRCMCNFVPCSFPKWITSLKQISLLNTMIRAHNRCLLILSFKFQCNCSYKQKNDICKHIIKFWMGEFLTPITSSLEKILATERWTFRVKGICLFPKCLQCQTFINSVYT